jgi:hypothetical protein
MGEDDSRSQSQIHLEMFNANTARMVTRRLNRTLSPVILAGCEPSCDGLVNSTGLRGFELEPGVSFSVNLHQMDRIKPQSRCEY